MKTFSTFNTSKSGDALFIEHKTDTIELEDGEQGLPTGRFVFTGICGKKADVNAIKPNAVSQDRHVADWVRSVGQATRVPCEDCRER